MGNGWFGFFPSCWQWSEYNYRFLRLTFHIKAFCRGKLLVSFCFWGNLGVKRTRSVAGALLVSSVS